jgi:6-phosphogluconolactonase
LTTTGNKVRVFGALLLPFLSLAANAGDSYFVYFGTYTASVSKGIYAARFDPASGKVEMLGAVAEAANPSFLAIRPDHRFLYAVNWRPSGAEPGNMVSAFSIDARTAKLSFLNKVPSKGEQPTHLALDSTGKMLVVANYASGTAAAFPLADDGRIGEAIWVDQHSGPPVEAHGGVPHAHDVLFSPDNRLVFIAELGLDRVYSYRFDAARRAISPYDPPFTATSTGSGPRHLALHPNGKFLYANNETNSTVTVFEREGGALKEVQTISTLPPDFKGRNSTAEIQIDRVGKFLYVSNRGHDSIAVFAVESAGSRITPVEYVSTQGKTPRNFSLDPTGAYLFAANENTSTVVLFRVDHGTGRLKPSGTVLDVPSPSCVIFLKTSAK